MTPTSARPPKSRSASVRRSFAKLGLVALTGCAPTIQHIRQTTEAIALSSLACDAGSTTQYLVDDPVLVETNPILGQHPPVGAIWIYLGAFALGAIAWNRVAETEHEQVAATMANIVLTAVEIRANSANIEYGASPCGIGRGGPWWQPPPGSVVTRAKP